MDRNYYRMMDDVDLLREAAENPTAELAVVLGERMEAVSTSYEVEIDLHADRAADFERDANRLDDQVYELRVEIEKYAIAAAAREDEISHLRDELSKLKETAK
jgi:predicted metallo-beta-lactamase superfamily hydrolase